MPYPSEHSARIEDPDKYDEFRRENNKFAQGIHAIWGIIKGPPRKSELQAIRFDAKKFSVAEAKKWLKDHDFKPIAFEPATGESSLDVPNIEYRSFPFTEVRTEEEQPKIVGHAAVFDVVSDLGLFKEKIEKGTFKKTIKEADIRALMNHDPNFVLGRVKSETLSLKEDQTGLATEILPPDTTWAKDLMTSMRRGDVDQMSFAFRTVKEDWEGEAQNPVRVLKEVELFDVSIVTFPAYPTTDAQVRSLVKVLENHLSSEPIQEDHSDELEDLRSQARLHILRKRLEIAEKI